MKDSMELYRALADKALATVGAVPGAHSTLFRPTSQSPRYYQILYLDQAGAKRQPQRRPGDATCHYCEDFNLANRKNINKQDDLTLGRRLEDCFQSFLEEQLNAGGADVICERGDDSDRHMPDLRIVKRRDRKIIAYLEVKAIFRPFLQISRRVNPIFECYSNSLTLDLSNGKKLLEQRSRVVEQLGVGRVAYVYWYDLPCVKGVFWLPSKRVYEIMDEQTAYDRRNVAGDFDSAGKKRGSTKKIYLPLLEMSDLNTLIERLLNVSSR